MKSCPEFLNHQLAMTNRSDRRFLVLTCCSAAVVLLGLATPLWFTSAASAQSSTDSATAPPDKSPAGSLQPVDTLRGALSGLEGLSFGMTNEMVTEEVSVPLHESKPGDLNSVFVGTNDPLQLQSAVFPVMPNETTPVKFVFRRGKLFGVCVCIGRLSPQEYLKLLNLLGDLYGGKGKPSGDMASFKAAIVAFENGRPHERITLNFDDYRVIAQLSWDEASSASVLDLIFKQREDSPDNPMDRMNRIRSRLGF